MGNYKVDTRYAKSLFDLALETGQLETVFTEMQLIDHTCRNNKELKHVLQSPIISAPKKELIISDLFKDHISTLTLSFISLILKKQRGIALEGIAASFIDLYKKHTGIQVVQVLTAQKMDAISIERIKSLLENHLHKTVEIEEVQKKGLIGGFQIMFNNNMYDASILSDFKKLKKELQNNEYQKR